MTKLKNKNPLPPPKPWEEVIKEFAKAMATKFFSVNRRLRSLEKRLSRVEDALTFVDETKFAKRTKKIDKTIHNLTLRLHAEIVRNCVLTEVIHEFPHVANKIIYMMSFDYEFFWTYRDLTLEEWAKIAESDLEPELAIKTLLMRPKNGLRRADSFISDH